jgi:1-acyl-sn-glycerol-3-phosphate acyltransferase
MLTFLRGARSLVSVLLVGAWFVLGSPILRLLVLPGAWLFPRRRFLLVGAYMKLMAAGMAWLLTLGGARFRRFGTIPTASSVLIVANHQSLVDILQITLLAKPRVPAYVTRKRYARFVPLVSASIRLLGSPIVDPKRDPVGSVEAIKRGARELPHGLILFPEGHRSGNGEILPFRSSGFVTILRERRQPVYLVLNDGAFRVRRFVDLLFRVHLIDVVSEVTGPFTPPAGDDELPPFLLELRGRLSARLAERRAAAAETGTPA